MSDNCESRVRKQRPPSGKGEKKGSPASHLGPSSYDTTQVARRYNNQAGAGLRTVEGDFVFLRSFCATKAARNSVLRDVVMLAVHPLYESK